MAARALRRLVRPALVLAAAVAGCGDAPGSPKAPAPSFALGVVANTQDEDTAAEHDSVRRLGVRWLREELRWSEIEPRRGTFDDRRYDRLVTLAARRGIRILPLLYLTPGWLSPEPRGLPPSLSAWGRYVEHVVRRYGPGGTFWRTHPELDGRLAMRTFEVWNEPYLAYFSTGGIRPARYAQLVRSSIEAGRRAKADVAFLASMETEYHDDAGTPRNWAQDVFAADPGLGKLLGGVAVHPYSQVGPADRSGPRRSQFARIEDILTTIRRNKVTTRAPLWITELGWSTCSARPACVDRDDQRRYWADALRLTREGTLRPAVGGLFVYSLHDLGAAEPDDPLGSFGLLGPDGSRKPAWDVVREAADAVRRG